MPRRVRRRVIPRWAVAGAHFPTMVHMMAKAAELDAEMDPLVRLGLAFMQRQGGSSGCAIHPPRRARRNGKPICLHQRGPHASSDAGGISWTPSLVPLLVLILLGMTGCTCDRSLPLLTFVRLLSMDDPLQTDGETSMLCPTISSGILFALWWVGGRMVSSPSGVVADGRLFWRGRRHRGRC